MNRTISRWILGTALTLITYAAVSDRPAHALAVFNSPYGATTPVSVYFGSCVQAGLFCTRLVWVRKSDGACTTVNIVTGSGGLTDTTRAYGSSGDDTFTSAIGDSAHPYPTPCGGLGTPNYNGHSMAFYGGAGSDSLFNYNSGDTWLIGEDGNDFLVSNGVGGVTGGNGNDTIVTEGAFSNEYVKGDLGNDCMQDINAAALTFDCGGGTDGALSGAGGQYPAVMIHCELRGSCP